MTALQKLKSEVLADGKIDADEITQIRTEIYADGVIDAEEVEFLFELNDAVSGNDNDPGWKELFVEAISAYILEDGMIDAEETALLLEKIQGDGAVDEVEKALLSNLKSGTTDFPAELEALLNK